MAMGVISGYELVEILGEGPRATVYKARDPKSGGWVAVKIFHSLEFENPRKLVQLNHPHLATICDAGRAGSQSFAVTEDLPGGTLKDHIRSLQSVGDVFPADQILTYAGQIGSALKYAHEKGVSHGDVKAENIMFSEDGTIKLMDFSPETNANAQAVEDSDIEGFGKLLYQMATGQSLFSVVAVPPIEGFRNDLPAAFVHLVEGLLDRRRQDRHEVLCRALDNLKSASPPPAETLFRTTMAAVAPASAAPPAFHEGRLLAGRFRIV